MTGADFAANATLRRALIDHEFDDLNACDEAAQEARRWAIGYGMTSGGAAGAVGVVGLVVDVPTSIALAMRTARSVGLCYGFGESGPAERSFVLSVLALLVPMTAPTRRRPCASSMRSIGLRLFRTTIIRPSPAWVGRELPVLPQSVRWPNSWAST